MDISDPQTLGFVVFGGFMVISAVAIVLVSTLSMKEMSYEEALAKQRDQLVHAQTQRAEKKKKKDKTSEKKTKTKKKEEWQDGKPSEPGSDSDKEPVVVTSTKPESDPKPMPQPEPEPTATTEPPATPPPNGKKKKKSAKVEPAAVMETVAKEVLVMAVAPVMEVAENVITEVSKEQTAAKTEEPKETSSKKHKSKNKPETVLVSSSASLLLPYGELMSAVSNMTLSNDETLKLMEVLKKKTSDTWQQRGDPLSALKKQLEEKEKLLTAQQEVATDAKSHFQELSKEKSKMVSLVASLRAELGARGQEVETLRANMQTADQEHLKQTQQLNQKIGSLQEQLENGSNTQLARLQQENSILRDALNQATSQAESRQNAELARLRQDCVRLGRELSERCDALRADEERRISLEAKMAAAEQELTQAKLVHADTEHALKQRLQEVCLELAALQQEAAAVSDLQGALASRETKLQELRAQLERQAAVQAGSSSEVEQLKNDVRRRDEQVGVLEVELSRLKEELQLRLKEADMDAAAGDHIQKDGSGSDTESEQPFESLEEDSQLLRLEEELQQVREELQQARNHGNELQEKLAAASSTAERLSEQREAELKAALAEAESRLVSLRSDFQASLQVLFPGVSVEVEQSNWLEVFTQKIQENKNQEESSHSELQSRLKDAEEKQTELQSEVDQSRKLLQETEAELQALKQRSEEEENVGTKKLSEAEQQTEKLKEQLMLLEAQLEKQLEEASFTQSYSEELAQVQSRLQLEQQQRQQLDRELQQARQEVLQQQQADQTSTAPLKEVTVELKEETSV
ncbi:hypothetical protein PAMA_016878 [Pampus argenteus]